MLQVELLELVNDIIIRGKSTKINFLINNIHVRIESVALDEIIRVLKEASEKISEYCMDEGIIIMMDRHEYNSEENTYKIYWTYLS